MITSEQLKRTYSYEEYKSLLAELLAQGKTTGHEQTEANIGYAKLNIQRMQRVEKTLAIGPEMKAAMAEVKKRYIWLVLTEGWCGDTAQAVPVLKLIADLSPNVDFRLMLRDDNPDVMSQYLTNGSRSIPKLICLEQETLKEIFTWGPRPAPLQEMVMGLIKDHVSKEEKGLAVQKWYNDDKGVTIQKEIAALVSDHMRG